MEKAENQADKQTSARYLKALNSEQRAELERVRQIVKSAAPDADEVMAYGMPGFNYKGKYLISYASFKNHMSIFPGSEATETLKPKLGDYKLSKGTIQFTLGKPLPEQIIRDVIKLGVARINSNS